MIIRSIFALLMFALFIDNSLLCTHTMQYYFWANYQQYGRNGKQTTQLYNQLLSSSPSLYVYKGYIVHLFEQEKYAEIVSLIKKLDSFFQNDPITQRYFALSLYKMELIEEAEKRFIELNNRFKSDQEIAYYTAQIYLRKQEPQNAILVIDTLLNNVPRKPTDALFYFMRAQAYLTLSELDKAYENAKKSIEIQSQFDKGWLMLALLDEQAGRIKQAIHGYQSFIEVTDPGQAQLVQRHLVELLAAERTNIKKEKFYYKKAAILYHKKRYTEALQSLNQCRHETNNPSFIILKIEILSALNRFEETVSILKKQALKDPQSSIWLKMIHLLVFSPLPKETLLKTFDELKDAYHKNGWFHIYYADLLLRIQKQEQALKELVLAEKFVIDDPLIKGKIAYQKAIIYFDQENSELFLENAKQSLSLIPDFSPVLNVLAFYYAQQKEKLEEAEAYVQKALQKDPHNAHILDTKGFILYKRKQYQEAENLFNKLITIAPDDATIHIHLAKVQYAMNKKNDARKTLEQAKQKVRYNHERKTIEKLRKKWQ